MVGTSCVMGTSCVLTIGLLFLVDCTTTQTETTTEAYDDNCEQYYAYPENCDDDSDCYVARMKMVKKPKLNGTMFVYMKITYKTSHYLNENAWFGIGMNKEPSMNSADAFIVTLDQTHLHTRNIQDWQVGNYSAGLEDPNQDDYRLLEVSTTSDDNAKIVALERECDTGNSQDLNICNGDFYWIFPYSGGPVGADGTIQKHTKTPHIVKAKPLRDCDFRGYPDDEKCHRIYEYPEKCSQSAGPCYQAAVIMYRNGGPYNDTVQIFVSNARNANMNEKSWFGIGFNSEPSMSSAVSILARVDEKGGILATEKWKLGFYSIGDKGSLENYKIYGGYAAKDGVSYLNIQRPCNTFDSEDINLCDGDFYWIFPTNGGPVGSDGQIQMHRETPVILKSSSLRRCEAETDKETTTTETNQETEKPILQKIKEAVSEFVSDLVDWVMNRK